MKAFLESIFLGFLQGITEFLPISSSGHLALSQMLFQTDQFFLLTLTVHFGTFISLIVFYRKDLVFMSQEVFQNPFQSLFFKIIIGSLPVLFVGFFFMMELKKYLIIFIMLLLDFWSQRAFCRVPIGFKNKKSKI